MFTKNLYVLSGRHAVRAKNLLEWSIFIEKGDRRVALDEIGDMSVSTVFLGVDRNNHLDGDTDADPILFETAVFQGEAELNSIQRYFTWAEAEAGHQEVCDALRAALLEAQGSAQGILDRIKDSIRS